MFFISGGALVLLCRQIFKTVTRATFPMLLRITGIEYYHGSKTKVPFYTGYHKGFKLVPITLVSVCQTEKFGYARGTRSPRNNLFLKSRPRIFSELRIIRAFAAQIFL